MTVKAIETRYEGCHFRSRSEARWAVFFDHLGVDWNYEPQGYELPSGRYLPDFFLPDLPARNQKRGVWWEVKGAPPLRREINLAWELYEATDHLVYIAHGGIPRDWLEPSSIQLVGATNERFALRDDQLVLIPDVGIFDQVGVSDLLLLDAYSAARSARFEHGWSGAS